VFLRVPTQIDMGVEQVDSADCKEDKSYEVIGGTLSRVSVMLSRTVSRMKYVLLVHGC
jgi:hypothetical protein